MLTGSGVLTLEDLSTGIHTFEASNNMIVGTDRNSSIDLEEDLTSKNAFCNGSIEYEVTPGINYITIPVTCSYLDGVMYNGDGVK